MQPPNGTTTEYITHTVIQKTRDMARFTMMRTIMAQCQSSLNLHLIIPIHFQNGQNEK